LSIWFRALAQSYTTGSRTITPIFASRCRDCESVHALCWRDRGDLLRKWLQMDRPVVEPDAAGVIEPGESVFEPIFVVSLRKVSSRMCAAAFRPSDSGVKTHFRLGEHIIEFERFSEVRVKDHRAIGDIKIVTHHCDGAIERAQTLLQQRAVAEDGAVTLHGSLHDQADRTGLCPGLATIGCGPAGQSHGRLPL